jgi:predicted DNA-binding protein
MEKKLSLRLDQGTYLVIEANAEKQGLTVSDWIRAAINENIKRSVNNRILDRLDERTYDLHKGMSEVKAMLVKLQESVDEIEPVEE